MLILSRSGSRLVVPSLSLEGIARQVWRLPVVNVEYIPNGVDCTRFAPRANHLAPDRPFTIGTVATLRPEKNLERLISLFSGLVGAGTPAELVIVGDGPEREKLEGAARASPHASRIRFAGSSAAPERELAGFDVFALTSSTEQMPLSVLEAMGSGLPVMSFAVGDVPQMVSPANRPFASACDDAAFLRGLLALAGSAALRQEIGRANREWVVAHYDQRRMLERYAALFD
jgi:glycosyltransferase involved in cell wall biosynthesis